ncbi:hypothetical protein [Streptomyces sp. NPDC047928]|uniref:hypothetical protein n=1 Tax=unclassified Streptomyces TaxID=2593676 RepID=UPI0037187337
MVRNVTGAVLALVGATAAVWSPFRAWYDGRDGRDYRFSDLFGGITATKADLWTSLLLPMVVAAVIAVLGLVLRSRLTVALAGVIVLGFTILWMVRQGQAEGGLAVNSDGSGLGLGVANAAGGGLLLLLAAAVMAGRPARHRDEEYEPESHPGPQPPPWQPGAPPDQGLGPDYPNYPDYPDQGRHPPGRDHPDDPYGRRP